MSTLALAATSIVLLRHRLAAMGRVGGGGRPRILAGRSIVNLDDGVVSEDRIWHY